MTRIIIAAALLTGAWWTICRALDAAARNLIGETR